MTAVAGAPAREGAYRANIGRFYLYRFFSNFQLWIPIWIVYLQRERGFTLTEITTLDATYWLVVVLSEIPTGAVADRWGRKPSLVLSAVLLAAAVALFATATNFGWVLLSYATWGLSTTLASGADTALLYDTLAALGRTNEFSRLLGRARAWMVAAALLASLLGAPLAAAVGLVFPIYLSAGLALIAVVVALALTEPPHRGTVRMAYGAILGEAARYALRHPRLRTMFVLAAVVGAAGQPAVMFVQPYLVGHGVPLEQFGLLRIPVMGLSIAGSLVAYRLIARFGERPVIYGLALLLPLALLGLGGVRSLAGFALFPVLAFGLAAFDPIASNYANQHAPAQLRATLASVGSMVLSLALAVSEPGMGFIADRASLPTAFLADALAFAVLGGLALAWWTAADRAGKRSP